jgi:hypothetical protein
LDLIAKLPQALRPECIHAALLRFRSEASAVLQRQALRARHL